MQQSARAGVPSQSACFTGVNQSKIQNLHYWHLIYCQFIGGKSDQVTNRRVVKIAIFLTMEVGEYVGLLQRDERARTFACLVEKLLLEFVAGKGSFSSFKSLQFPPLPSYFRLLIHATARSFNLR